MKKKKPLIIVGVFVAIMMIATIILTACPPVTNGYTLTGLDISPTQARTWTVGETPNVTQSVFTVTAEPSGATLPALTWHSYPAGVITITGDGATGTAAWVSGGGTDADDATAGGPAGGDDATAGGTENNPATAVAPLSTGTEDPTAGAGDGPAAGTPIVIPAFVEIWASGGGHDTVRVRININQPEAGPEEFGIIISQQTASEDALRWYYGENLPSAGLRTFILTTADDNDYIPATADVTFNSSSAHIIMTDNVASWADGNEPYAIGHTLITATVSFDGLSLTSNPIRIDFVPQTFLISTGEQLAQGLAARIDATFNIVENITLENWTPVGTPQAPFTGTLQGMGGVITRLTITEAINAYENNTGDYFAGLIGVNKGTIRHITIESVTLNVEVNHAYLPENPADNNVIIFVGALVALNLSLIEHSRVLAGTVSAACVSTGLVDEDNTPRLRVGMLVGRNEDEDAIIRYSSSNGTVFADTTSNGVLQNGNNRTGGLVGELDNGNILRSFSTSNVSATGGGQLSLGGLVGYTQRGGIVHESFATGNVTALGGGHNVFVGGLIGFIDRSGNVSSFEITNSFATGNATIQARTLSGGGGNNIAVGGLIGAVDHDGRIVSILIENVFATGNASVTGRANGAGAAGLIGRIHRGNAANPGTVNLTITNAFSTGNATSNRWVGNALRFETNAAQPTTLPPEMALNNIRFSDASTATSTAEPVLANALHNFGTATPLLDLLTQATNGFDADIWTFSASHEPSLTWANSNG